MRARRRSLTGRSAGQFPRTVFRGTQRASIEGVRKGLSWTYSLPVAIIWSARPPSYRNLHAEVLDTSTIHIGVAHPKAVLSLGRATHRSLAEVLELLRFGKPNGITLDEVQKILNYMHNRITGRARGGEFLHKVYDEDGEPKDERDLPLSFAMPFTLISEFREEWESTDERELPALAERLEADVFIYADAPSFQTVARRLGYDAIEYADVFDGGVYASRELLGRELSTLPGIEMLYDLESKRTPTHLTLRPLVDGVVDVTRTVLTSKVLADWKKEGRRRGR